MDNYNKIVTLNEILTDQINSYAVRPTKAESRRIRLTLGAIKKLVTLVRSELVAADKA